MAISTVLMRNGKMYYELTGLFLDVQCDLEAFIQEVHDTLKVGLFKLPRGQSRGTWYTRGVMEDKQQPYECHERSRVEV